MIVNILNFKEWNVITEFLIKYQRFNVHQKALTVQYYKYSHVEKKEKLSATYDSVVFGSFSSSNLMPFFFYYFLMLFMELLKEEERKVLVEQIIFAWFWLV